MKTTKLIAITMMAIFVFAVVILQLIGAVCLISLVFFQEISLTLRVIGVASGIAILIGFVCAVSTGWVSQVKDFIKSYIIIMW